MRPMILLLLLGIAAFACSADLGWGAEVVQPPLWLILDAEIAQRGWWPLVGTSAGRLLVLPWVNMIMVAAGLAVLMLEAWRELVSGD